MKPRTMLALAAMLPVAFAAVAEPQPTVRFAEGVEMPRFGLGTFAQGSNETCSNSVAIALKYGYRHIDTAHAYNDERGVGMAIRASGVPRSEIWVTSKLWPSEYGEGKTAEAIDTEVHNMIKEQYERAKKLLEEHKEGHAKLARILMENEVIFAEDVEKIFGKRPWASRSEEIFGTNEKENEDSPAEPTVTEQQENNAAE